METNYSYSQQAMIPDDGDGWDRYQNRLARYAVYNGYYNNVAYFQIMTYSQGLKYWNRLYKHVRGVYNPVWRLVELYAGKVYPGALDFESGSTGAVPILDADKKFRKACSKLWQWSQWSTKKGLYVRDGSRYGDAFIKIVDDVTAGRVRMEIVDPRKIKHVEVDGGGDITRVIIEYRMRLPGSEPNSQTHLYTEEITPESFTTMIDGRPGAVHQNGQGSLVPEWPNEYGFVPMIHAKHIDLGLVFGGTPYLGTLHKIDELNDFASIVNDGGRKQVRMPLVSSGVRGDVTIGTDNSDSSTNTADDPQKDEVTIINLPGKDAELKSIAPSISLADAAIIIDKVNEEIERDNPELTLHRIRQGGNLTAPGIRSAYDDGASRIIDARASFDGGLIKAQRMAVAVGGFRNYDGFKGYGLESKDEDETLHSIGERPIIADTLGKREKIELTIQAASSSAAEVALDEIGYTQDKIDMIVNKQAETQQAAELENPLFGAGTAIDNNPENPEAQVTDQDVEEAQQLTR